MASAPRAFVLGLTGGIASGKSTAAKTLARLGAACIDCDLLGHEAYQKGEPAIEQLTEHFGRDILTADESVDRAALGQKVFGKPDEMKKLTDIVWPFIASKVQHAIQQVSERAPREAGRVPVAVVDAAVLLEAGWHSMVDEIWVVAIDVDTARTRLMARNRLTAEQADKRIASQMSVAERVRAANVVIWNQGTTEELDAAVEREWSALQARL